MIKEQAFEEAHQIFRLLLSKSDAMQNIILTSAYRDKDYKWYAKQLDILIDKLNKLKQNLNG